MIKAVIYDLDDLMVNSNPLHFEASSQVFEKYKVDLGKLPSSVRSGFIGMRVKDILKEIVRYFNLKIDFEKLHQERSELLLKLVREKLKMMPGLVNSLKRIKGGGLKIALASSGAWWYINLVLEKFKVADYFDVIVSGDDVKRGKPDPETYLIAVKKLGIRPSQAVVLEDATNGIAAAKAAGCFCIAIKNPYTPKQDLSRADLALDSLADLSLKHLQSISTH